MMNELIGSVTALVGEEYRRAAAEWGPAANSPHEGYALLKEEAEEAEEQVSIVSQKMITLWWAVKANTTDSQIGYINEVRTAAILGACELIQVAAMADKALKTYSGEERKP